MVAPFGKLLDDDARPECGRMLPGLAQSCFVIESPGNSSTMICGQRFENYWISNLRRDFQRALDSSRDVTFRNRKSDVLENSLGVVFILRDLDADRARRIGKRRLNAMKIPAESELDKRIVVEPANG